MGIRKAKQTRPVMIKVQSVAIHNFDLCDDERGTKSIGQQVDELLNNMSSTEHATKLVIDLDPDEGPSISADLK